MRARTGIRKAKERKAILSAGHNTALLRVRNATLETAGYRVVTTKESKLLLELAEKQDFHAVVLCSSMPADLREGAVRELKKIKRSLPVVVLCNPDEERRFEDLADAIVPAQHGTSQPLIEAISKYTGEPQSGRKII